MSRIFKHKKLIFPGGKIQENIIKSVYDEIKLFVSLNENLGPFERHKPHLLIPSIYDLSINKEILKRVHHFLGKDAFLWYSVFFLKSKCSEEYIPWHYDDYFWSITGENGCTVWLAIDDVTDEMGPMEFCFDPISSFTHQTETNVNNMLSRGNTSDFAPKKDSDIKKVCLKKGEFSIHSNKVWHRSGANKSNKDRVAVALRYITIDAFPTKLKYIRRGAVGDNFNKKFFYSEKRPIKLSKPLKKANHIYSIFISLFISAFGDDKRNLITQFNDLMKFTFSKKGLLILFGGLKSFLKNNNISKKINDG